MMRSMPISLRSPVLYIPKIRRLHVPGTPHTSDQTNQCGLIRRRRFQCSGVAPAASNQDI